MKRLSLICGLLLLTNFVSSQTLDECRKLARERYPEIKQYDLIAQARHYNLSNAAKAWIPQVQLSGQATYQSATPSYPDAFDAMMQANGIEMSGISKDQYKIAIDVSQQIWDGGKSKAERSIADTEAEEQRRRVDVSLYELQSKIDNIYFGILLLDERRRESKALIAMLESNLNRMRSYYKNGVAMQSDVDIIEAELLTARQALGQIESSRTSYRRMLELFIGQPLTADRLERPAEVSVASRTSAHPELNLFNAQENRLEAQRKAINSSVMPRFSAFAQGYYGYPGLNMFKSMTSTEWSLNAIVGVRMSWNIGALYTRKNNLDKIDIAQRQIATGREVFLFNTALQMTQDDGEIERLRKAVEDDGRIVELRQRVRKAAESQLENGVIDATDLLRKITEETTAIQSRSTHEIELLQAIYRLKTTLNQ